MPLLFCRCLKAHNGFGQSDTGCRSTLSPDKSLTSLSLQWHRDGFYSQEEYVDLAKVIWKFLASSPMISLLEHTASPIRKALCGIR